MPPTPAERGERRNGLPRGSAMTWPPVPPSQLMERRDADGETCYATDTAIAGVALQWRSKHAGDRAGTGPRMAIPRTIAQTAQLEPGLRTLAEQNIRME